MKQTNQNKKPKVKITDSEYVPFFKSMSIIKKSETLTEHAKMLVPRLLFAVVESHYKRKGIIEKLCQAEAMFLTKSIPEIKKKLESAEHQLRHALIRAYKWRQCVVEHGDVCLKLLDKYCKVMKVPAQEEENKD